MSQREPGPPTSDRANDLASTEPDGARRLGAVLVWRDGALAAASQPPAARPGMPEWIASERHRPSCRIMARQRHSGSTRRPCNDYPQRAS